MKNPLPLAVRFLVLLGLPMAALFPVQAGLVDATQLAQATERPNVFHQLLMQERLLELREERLRLLRELHQLRQGEER